MGDVSSYQFQVLEDRVKALEQENLRKIQQRTERLRRKSDLWFYGSTFFWILLVAIVVTAAVTKAIVEK